MTKYCTHCERFVLPKRKIGLGTILMVFITYGFWLFAVLLYSKRCPICQGIQFSDQKPEKNEKAKDYYLSNSKNQETEKIINQNNNIQNHFHVSEVTFNRNRYHIELYHEGLNEHKTVYAHSQEILNHKVNLIKEKWSSKWKVNNVRQNKIINKVNGIQAANLKTENAQQALSDIENILIYALSKDNKIIWDSLKQNEDSINNLPLKPNQKIKKEYPEKPDNKKPIFSLYEKIIKSAKNKKIKEYESNHLELISEWKKEIESIDFYNLSLENEYKHEMIKWEKIVTELEEKKVIQREYNLKIDSLKNDYNISKDESIMKYCSMVLDNSIYPDTFPQTFEIEYNPENKILIVEYQLPSIDCFPKVKEVKYIESLHELKEINISETQLNKIFDDTLYKITLRTIYELFQADSVNAINAISFNGWIETTNKATGQEENNCIISIQVKKDEISKIDLSKVDPKLCFKSLKGIASSKLTSLTPIQPILQINKKDKRFVQSYDVTNQIDNSTNLAAMDWEDFEHLIRELFEKEFQSNGGEVKVTQASRDGGVDAIAFDPDPIRGGKIVIQAKRYTNTVGVSAVRDLYGTVLNEGATKGILVTTADYGSDSYDFAKGKPLTLLNGSNLLHLLEKHGHHAKIDIREAKKILAENDKR